MKSSKMEPEDDIVIANPIHLGILGSRQDATPEKILACIHPMLSVLGRCPERIILPAEGYSSIFLQDWATETKIPNQVYESNWGLHGRRASIIRDSRIENEVTHLLIFLNKRSVYYEKAAKRLFKKGKKVFTVTYGDWKLEEISSGCEIRPSSPPPPQKTPSSLQSPPSLPVKSGHTAGKGKVQALLK